MADYVLSARAQQDLAYAINYSFHNYGPAQATRYDALLRQALASLGEKPNPGTPYRSKRKHTFWLACREHVLFYRRTPKGTPRVLRILHRRMLPRLVLE